MYLDKPLRAHTLFQAITRTNRRWTNPETGQEKTAGLVVDYVGLGTEIAEGGADQAARARREDRRRRPRHARRRSSSAPSTTALERFDGIDRSSSSSSADGGPGAARRRGGARRVRPRVPDRPGALRVPRARHRLSRRRSELDYRWLAKVYQSVQPAMTPDALLWQRLGAKTHELIAEHIGEVEVGKGGPSRSSSTRSRSSAEAARPRRRAGTPETSRAADSRRGASTRSASGSRRGSQANPSSATYTLARRAARGAAPDLHRDGRGERRVPEEAARGRPRGRRGRPRAGRRGRRLGGRRRSDGRGPSRCCPTSGSARSLRSSRSIKPEVTPDIVERVVHEIDAVVMGVRFTGWQTSREGDRTVKFEIRQAFKKFGLEPTGELFDRAYAYVAEHY